MKLPAIGRFLLPVLAISGLLLAVVLFAAAHINHLQLQSAQMLEDSIHTARVAEQLEFQVEEFRHRLSPDLWRESLADPNGRLEVRRRIEDWLSQAELSARTDQERGLISRMRTGLAALDAGLESAEGLATDDLRDDHIARLTETTLDLEVLGSAQEFLNQVQTRLEEAQRENQRQSRRLVRTLLWLGILGALAGAAIGGSVARALRKSILRLNIPIRDVAGKLNEVVGPLNLSAETSLEELGPVLQRVSQEVTSVVEKLHASHQEVARAEQLAALGQLAAGMAHEIRNPLMCIKTLVQVAAASPDATLDRRDLQVLDEEINRLEELLREFLEFAHPGRFTKSPVEFRRIVDGTVSFLQPRAEQRGITLSCELPPGPVMVHADANRLRQSLLNLLLNALDASPRDGEIQVTLSVANDDQQGRRCELRVADEGPGIPPEARNRIFEPFYSTKETGLGLGLPICQRVIEAHQGTIEVRNRPEGGAEFLVRLPLADGAISESAVMVPVAGRGEWN